MHRMTRTLVVGAAGAAIIASVAACSSSGNSGDKNPVATISSLKDGVSTSVALDPGFVKALGTLHVKPGLEGTAKKSGAIVTFPITGGHVTVYKKGAVTPYVQGVIKHNGSGLTLTAGGTKVTLENFVIDPGNNSKLTGDVLVNGKQAVSGAKLFDLDGNTLKPITINGAGVAKLTGTRVLLSSDAASLLNKTFGTDALKSQTLIGIATILANSK